MIKENMQKRRMLSYKTHYFLSWLLVLALKLSIHSGQHLPPYTIHAGML